MSKDPIGLFGGLNSKIYVKDPNQWVDTMGLMADYAWTDGNGSFSRTKASKHKYAADSITKAQDVQMQRESQILSENRQKTIDLQEKNKKTVDSWNASAQSMNEINRQLSKVMGKRGHWFFKIDQAQLWPVYLEVVKDYQRLIHPPY